MPGLLQKIFGSGRDEREARQIAEEYSIKTSGNAVVIRQISVSREDVLAGNISGPESLARSVEKELRASSTLQQPWNLTISGYDTDPRGLWEVPEVRAWCQKVHRSYPFLPFLISQNSLSFYLLCLLEIEETKRTVRHLSSNEEEIINTMVSSYAKADPTGAKTMRESLTTGAEVHLKDKSQKETLRKEVAAAGTVFFLGSGIGQTALMKLVLNATVRVAMVLNSIK